MCIREQINKTQVQRDKFTSTICYGSSLDCLNLRVAVRTKKNHLKKKKEKERKGNNGALVFILVPLLFLLFVIAEREKG